MVCIGAIFEYQAGATTTYYAGPAGPVALRRVGYVANNGIFYMVGDHLGSTSVLLNQDGTVAKQEYYYPFGGNRDSTFSVLTTKRFTGQYHEAGLPSGEGLSYYNARWYDAQLGRFLSADTLVPNPGSPQNFNRLSYVSNNPLRYTDPTGHVNDQGGADGSGGPPSKPKLPGSTVSNSYSGPGYYYVYYYGFNPYRRGYNPYASTHRAKAGMAHKYQRTNRTSSTQYGLTYREQMINRNQIDQSCQYWQDCYESVVTREEMKPDSFIFGVSGSGGFLKSGVGGQELVWNFLTNETDLFGYAGAGTTAGAKLVGTVYTGFVWNLDQNADYSGSFSTLTIDLAFIKDAQVNLFWTTGTVPFTGKTWGLSGGYTPAGVGAAISYVQTFYGHEFNILK